MTKINRNLDNFKIIRIINQYYLTYQDSPVVSDIDAVIGGAYFVAETKILNIAYQQKQ